MVKTATNPTIEAATAARSATEKANQTNELGDIEDAISEWEKVMPNIINMDSSQEEEDILVSYANVLLLRWNLNHQLDDVRKIVSNLEAALGRLPHPSTKLRYDIMIRLAKIHENWYQTFKDNSEALKSSIQYWEDAYGLSAILRRMKDAVGIIPSTLLVSLRLNFAFRQLKFYLMSPIPTSLPSRVKYWASMLFIRQSITIKSLSGKLDLKHRLGSKFILERST
jgi:hypothetical protein